MPQRIRALSFALLLSLPVYATLPEYTSGSHGAPNHWDFDAFPVQFSINPSVNGNYPGGSAAAVAVIQSSFQTWVGAPNAALSVTQGPNSSITSVAFDQVNNICFICSGDYSLDSTTLAVTYTWSANKVGQDTGHGTTASFIGQIIEADIIFNPAIAWSTGGTPAAGTQDLQSVATHEIGHFFGLDHSGVVRAVMFPFAAQNVHQLSYDDDSGIAFLNPKSTPDFATGSISGQVTFAPTGGGVFGGHVFASSTTASPSVGFGLRKSPIGAMTDPAGHYVLRGLPVDSYTVGVEPLDLPLSNGDISHYDGYYGRASVQTNFNTRWH